MSTLSPAGVMGTIGSRCRSPRVLIALMTLLCPAGFATRHAISIGVHNHGRIPLGSSAIRIASRSGPILEMAIFAAPLELIMTQEMQHIRVLLVVRAELLPLIQLSIIKNSAVKCLAPLHTRNVLQVINNTPYSIASILEAALVHSCQEEAPHAIRPLMTEQFIARQALYSVQMASATRNALTATMAGKYAIRFAQQALFHAVMSSVSQALSVQQLSQPQL